MLTSATKNSSMKFITLAAIIGSTVFSHTSDSLAFQENPFEQGNCSFSRELEDRDARSQFTAKLEQAKQASVSSYGEVFENTVTFTTGDGESLEIDSFSFDCLACHDGLNAPVHELRVRNDNRTNNDGNSLGSHPIGMHYGSHAYANNELKSISELNHDMVFVDGKVGCLSCHNPLNPGKKHLVMSNDNSRLCFSCHNK